MSSQRVCGGGTYAADQYGLGRLGLQTREGGLVFFGDGLR